MRAFERASSSLLVARCFLQAPPQTYVELCPLAVSALRPISAPVPMCLKQTVLLPMMKVPLGATFASPKSMSTT